MTDLSVRSKVEVDFFDEFERSIEFLLKEDFPKEEVDTFIKVVANNNSFKFNDNKYKISILVCNQVHTASYLYLCEVYKNQNNHIAVLKITHKEVNNNPIKIIISIMNTIK